MARTPNLAKDSPRSPFEEMCEKYALALPCIRNARSFADEQVQGIKSTIADAGIELGDSLSLIAFGSLARRESTKRSDVDWTLLVNGPVDANHLQTANQINRALREARYVEPGDTGTFGTLASSHDLVHHVGGLEDTNQNMTRRLLLLLESIAIVNEDVRSQVVRAVLDRYIVCGRGVSEGGESQFHVPRFLLNDVVRYWRTIAVDYAAKKWEKADDGWALRNAKLRVSRKMTFVKGLLLCLDCELSPNKPPWSNTSQLLFGKEAIEKELVSGCARLIEQTPIDLLSRLLLRINRQDLANSIFENYDAFLDLVGDERKREQLRQLTFDNACKDSVFEEVRRIGKAFAEALEILFFRSDESLTKLTQKYGVF